MGLDWVRERLELELETGQPSVVYFGLGVKLFDFGSDVSESHAVHRYDCLSIVAIDNVDFHVGFLIEREGRDLIFSYICNVTYWRVILRKAGRNFCLFLFSLSSSFCTVRSFKRSSQFNQTQVTNPDQDLHPPTGEDDPPRPINNVG